MNLAAEFYTEMRASRCVERRRRQYSRGEIARACAGDSAVAKLRGRVASWRRCQGRSGRIRHAQSFASILLCSIYAWALFGGTRTNFCLITQLIPLQFFLKPSTQVSFLHISYARSCIYRAHSTKYPVAKTVLFKTKHNTHTHTQSQEMLLPPS